MRESKPEYIPPTLAKLWPELDPQKVRDVLDVMDSPEYQESRDRVRALRTKLEQNGKLIPGKANPELEKAMASHKDILHHKGFTSSEIAAAFSASLGELRLPPK